MFYIYLSFLALSNDTTLGGTGEEPSATAPKVEEEETPQQLAEWTPDDIF